MPENILYGYKNDKDTKEAKRLLKDCGFDFVVKEPKRVDPEGLIENVLSGECMRMIPTFVESDGSAHGGIKAIIAYFMVINARFNQA